MRSTKSRTSWNAPGTGSRSTSTITVTRFLSITSRTPFHHDHITSKYTPAVHVPASVEKFLNLKIHGFCTYQNLGLSIISRPFTFEWTSVEDDGTHLCLSFRFNPLVQLLDLLLRELTHLLNWHLAVHAEESTNHMDLLLVLQLLLGVHDYTPFYRGLIDIDSPKHNL